MSGDPGENGRMLPTGWAAWPYEPIKTAPPFVPCPLCDSKDTAHEDGRAWCNDCDAVGPADAWADASGWRQRYASLELAATQYSESRDHWQQRARNLGAEVITWLNDWAASYPESVFPNPDIEQVHAALAAAKIPLDRLYGAWSRTLLGKVAKEARMLWGAPTAPSAEPKPE
jgi:hypothetical protein